MRKILISSNPANLAEAIALYATSATVEAEYGEKVVNGRNVTLAHHGPRSGNPAPCLAENMTDSVAAIGLSHVDLDTLGGVMAILGVKPEVPGFWELAAFIDTNGAHKVNQSGASAENISRLYAFWAWSQSNRIMAERDGSVTDVTVAVSEAADAIVRICKDDGGLLAAGETFRNEMRTLNYRSFVQSEGGVIVRVYDAFTNHLYEDPQGDIAKAVVAFNTSTGGITVSLADPIEGVSSMDIVQRLWGSEAGGHAGIAGSPRAKRMELADLLNAFNAVQQAISD